MPISIFQFSNTKPQNGTINLLYSQSIEDSGNFTIIGATIPFESSNGVDIENSLQQLTEFTVNKKGSPEDVDKIIFDVSQKTRKSGYYFVQFDQSSYINNDTFILGDDSTFISESFTNSSGSFDSDQNGSFNLIPSASVDEAVLMDPFIVGSFTNSDFEPLLSNAVTLEPNSFRFVVDRNESQINPKNYDAIVSRSAVKANVQDSNYTDSGLINARYDGTKLNSGSVVGDDPGLSFISFGGSIHTDDSDNGSIAAISPSERKIEQLYFNFDRLKIISSSASDSSFASIPDIGNYIHNFNLDTHRYVRLVNSKIFNLESGAVITTDQAGLVIGKSENLIVLPTPSPSLSVTPSITPSVTPSVTATPSVTPSVTATPSVTPTISVTPSVTPSTSTT